MTSQNRDIDAKRRILSEHMIEALNNETNERKRLEHLLMVYEGREKSAHVIRSSVRAFDLSDVPFNDFDIKAVSFLISLAKNLDGINFSRCNLNVTSIETLADHILASPVKVLHSICYRHYVVGCLSLLTYWYCCDSSLTWQLKFRSTKLTYQGMSSNQEGCFFWQKSSNIAKLEAFEFLKLESGYSIFKNFLQEPLAAKWVVNLKN